MCIGYCNYCWCVDFSSTVHDDPCTYYNYIFYTSKLPAVYTVILLYSNIRTVYIYADAVVTSMLSWTDANLNIKLYLSKIILCSNIIRFYIVLTFFAL